MCSHYHDYAAGEACSVCGHSAASASAPAAAAKDSAFPSEVVPEFLYLGSYDNASRSELLKAMGITAILNVRLAATQITQGGCNCVSQRPHTPARGSRSPIYTRRARLAHLPLRPLLSAAGPACLENKLVMGVLDGGAMPCVRRWFLTSRTCTATRSPTLCPPAWRTIPKPLRWRAA